MASRSLDDLTPDTKRVAQKFLAMADARGIDVRVVATLRTCDEQNALYARGRTEPGQVCTNASGCRSWHTWGRAFDVLIEDEVMPDGLVYDGSDHRYDELGDIAKSLGMQWGGDFHWGRDAGHFEYHPGLEISDLCPDPDPAACNEQIQRHNAQYNPPVDPSIQPVAVFESQQNVSSVGVVFSALVGALVYQVVSIAFEHYRGKS